MTYMLGLEQYQALDKDTCINCREPIQFGWPVKDKWSHHHGDTYCHTPNGFCNNELKQVMPPYHPAGATL